MFWKYFVNRLVLHHILHWLYCRISHLLYFEYIYFYLNWEKGTLIWCLEIKYNVTEKTYDIYLEKLYDNDLGYVQ